MPERPDHDYTDNERIGDFLAGRGGMVAGAVVIVLVLFLIWELISSLF